MMLAGAALLLSGCGSLHSFRMVAPSQFGMDEVTAKLYVEPAIPLAQRGELQAQIDRGRDRVKRFYGSIETSPYFVACATRECAVRFGSYGERATAFGDLAIRLSPDGLIAAVIAHEWSHAELYQRVGGGWSANAIPRWFDEGVAVVVADEPHHSEDNWSEIRRRGLPTPALTELVSRQDWTAAVRRYGETLGDHPANLRVVYSAAGHALRHWLGCAGASAVVDLLRSVRRGEAFDSAYDRLGSRCEPVREDPGRAPP